MEALNQEEREFGEKNHALIYSFLNYYKLPETEYYDICAIAYLQAVKDYHRKPGLREKYCFSTIAFKKMTSAKIRKYHSDRIRDAYIAFSLNDLDPEEREYIEQLPDPRNTFLELEAIQEAAELLEDILPALTERQRNHLVKLAEGEKPREMIQGLRVSLTQFWQDRKAIREATAAVVEQESRGGGYLTHGQAGCY